MPALSNWTYLALAVVASALAYLFDVPKVFGAHPWWSQKVVLIGASAGLIVALIAARSRFASRAWIASVLLAVSAAGITGYGKTRFVASFGDDAAAGQMWYFGWIAISLGVFLALALIGFAMRPKST